VPCLHGKAFQGGPWPIQNFGWDDKMEQFLHTDELQYGFKPGGHNAIGPGNNWPVCSLVVWGHAVN